IALAVHELQRLGSESSLLTLVGWASQGLEAVTGLLLASYTGVLIGATAIPVWFANRRLLPPHFVTSGLGGPPAIPQVAGFLIPVTQVLGLVATGVETGLGVLFEKGRSPVFRPLHLGGSGLLMRVAGLLTGPVALALRLWAPSPDGRRVAAICFLIGAL